ncbi:MAG: CxxxxCH/CxxCH domain-containing protein [Nitrospirae bacterium]|nr:CxxxxCH/CxxCH domain-containing protein [Nitrospirota bacterium]
MITLKMIKSKIAESGIVRSNKPIRGRGVDRMGPINTATEKGTSWKMRFSLVLVIALLWSAYMFLGVDGINQAQASGVINSCNPCHGDNNSFRDNSTHRDPVLGRFPGSHNKHADNSTGYGYVCTTCHINNTTFGHQNDNITMASPITGTAGSYSRGTTWVRDNNTGGKGTCSNTYCHGDGTSVATGNVKANTSPTWGSSGPLACSTCHGYSPAYANLKKSPTAATGTNWTLPAAVTKDNGTYATYANTAQNYLFATNLGYSTSDVPDNTTILGIAVIVSGNSANATAANRAIKVGLTKNGTAVVGTTQAFILPLNYDSPTLSGGPGSLWGTTWTPAEIRATTFGVAIADNDTTSAIFKINSAKVVVYTTDAPKMNSHQGPSHSVAGCAKCHNKTTTDNTTITNNKMHGRGQYSVDNQSGTTFTYTYSSGGGTCATISCHGGGSAQWGGQLGCVNCHSAAVNTTVAKALDAAVTTRSAIVPSFVAASSHVRSRGGTVTNNDCGVCHMEGSSQTGLPSATYHGNGYIDLRDPDSGTAITVATWSNSPAGPGSYSSGATPLNDNATTTNRLVRFSRNLASATLEVQAVSIMINQCLKCHDANGANAADNSSRVPGGTATKPFATTVAANPSGAVLDVAAQFASTNRSYHPITVKQNNGYAGGTRMLAPWNAVTKSATTTVWGPLMTCWDCHAPNASTGTLTTSGIHGGAVNGTDAVPLRGNVYTAGGTTATNLCANCHYLNPTNTTHGTGSALTSSPNGSMTYFNNQCYYCHGSYSTRASAIRPYGAGDAHGYNTRVAGGAFAAAQGYAFIRHEGFYGGTYNQTVKQVGATTYTAQCSGVSNTTGGACSRGSMGNYTPGGIY